MISKWPKPVLFSLVAAVFLLFALSLSLHQLAIAQDVTAEPTLTPVPTDPPTLTPVPPTEIPTEIPTEVPTATLVPTEIPTEPPTLVPTDLPTEPPTLTPVPTEGFTEVPTALPPETGTPGEVLTETPTVVPSETPTLVAGAPELIVPDAALLKVSSGQPLAFEMRVKDDDGPVTVSADTTLTSGTVTLAAAAPTETAAPFYTVVSVSYLPAAGYSGVDRFVLTATNRAGNTASAVIEITVSSPSSTATPTETPTETAETTKELIISYRPGASDESINAMLNAIQAVELKRIPQIGVMLVQVPDSMANPDTARAAIQSSGDTRVAAAGVAAVEKNTEYHIDYVPNDAYLGSQWALHGEDGGTAEAGAMWVERAWNMSPKRGTGVIVAVIDTGIDLQHPELVGQTVPGWDFVNDDNYPDDDHGHGTHVSGIIAAKTNNGTGIAGIAYKAKIMPLKVCDAYGGCADFDIMNAIVHAVDNKAQVINMSLGQCDGPKYSERAAVQYAISRGVVVVAAAGNGLGSAPGSACYNDPTLYSYPASYPGVISVAAHDSAADSAGDPAGYGYNTNDRIDVSAPGIGILSTLPLEYGSYAMWNGTSMAAPQVSGIAALLISAKVATTPANVREALTCGAYDMGAEGYDNLYGWGIVQADWAMNWRENSSSCKISPPNDNIETPTSITKVPYSVAQPVSSRSVTSQDTDPSICGTVYPQTLWYKFVPAAAGYYQVSTLGSSYDTVVGVFQGNPGALTPLACSDDAVIGTFSASQLVVGLNAKLPYYIAVAGYDVVEDQVVELRINQGTQSNGTKNEENSPYLTYSGTWATASQSGASGGKTLQTSDNAATVAFSFRGVGFDLGRTVGPDQGSMDVWADGLWVLTLDNRAALKLGNQKVSVPMSGSATGQWHTVILRRSSTGSAGPVSVDTITTYDNIVPAVITVAVTDDRDAKVMYLGGLWSDLYVPGSYKNTVRSTTAEGAWVRFRAKGDTITLYRNTNTGYGSMNVWVDGTFYATVQNDSIFGYNVPFVITNLPAVEHVVEVVNNASSRLDFDAIGVVGNTPVMKANIQVNNRATSILYSGVWTNVSYPYALKSTNDPQARAQFAFDGNFFCIGYATRPDGQIVQVFVDGVSIATLSTVGPESYGNEWCTTDEGTSPTLLADGRHRVLIAAASAGTSTLDYILPLRYMTLTPSRGLVPETDASFLYLSGYGVWYRATGARSIGGYPAKNGSIVWTETDGTNGGRVAFFINGSGFILYTGVGSGGGSWDVYVDGVFFTTLALYDPWRWRPIGYGVADLGPGIHIIELRAVVSSGQYADFDGVRVFP